MRRKPKKNSKKLALFRNNSYLCIVSNDYPKCRVMCNVTLSYNENNALARRKLAALLATGLFTKLDTSVAESVADKKAHRKEVEDFLYGSKILAAKAFAKHL